MVFPVHKFAGSEFEQPQAGPEGAKHMDVWSNSGRLHQHTKPLNVAFLVYTEFKTPAFQNQHCKFISCYRLTEVKALHLMAALGF